jgi:hypothetical protein
VQAALEAALGVTLPGTLVFDYPTISDIAGHIEGLLASQLSPPPPLAHARSSPLPLAHAQSPPRLAHARSTNSLLGANEFAAEVAFQAAAAVDAAIRDVLGISAGLPSPGKGVIENMHSTDIE